MFYISGNVWLQWILLMLTLASLHVMVGAVVDIDLDFQPMSIKDWFREPQFYLVAGVYMSTRLFVNLSQAYLPLYLQESLELRSTYVATIPLVMYSSSFLVSRVMKFLNNKAGRKLSYLIGAIVG